VGVRRLYRLGRSFGHLIELLCGFSGRPQFHTPGEHFEHHEAAPPVHCHAIDALAGIE
jgi:hypothetical protein